MELSQALSSHLRNVYFGGNWTASSLKEHIEGVDINVATVHYNGCHSILALTYHIHYFIRTILPVLQNGPLTGRDTYSFDHPEIHTQKDWDEFKKTIFREAEIFIATVEELPEEKLLSFFVDPKYGSYYDNLSGLIEHTHYHLGQIVILKKILLSKN